MCLNQILTLVDSRLLHGLVVAAYVRRFGIREIVIADDDVFKDPILRQIYELVKPPETSVCFLTLEQAARAWQEPPAQKGIEPCLLLIRNIENVKSLYDMGMRLENITINDTKAAPNKKRVQNIYFLDAADVAFLDRLAEHGVSVSFRGNTSWDAVKKDYL